MNNYYTKFLFESETPEPKDIKRIKDIITKSAGDMGKAQKLAANMVAKIKDLSKMERRYEAAVQELGETHPVTKEFEDGVISMGGSISRTLPQTTTVSPVSTDSVDNEPEEFSTEVESLPVQDQPEVADKSEDPDNFYIESDEDDLPEYDKLNNYLEDLYNTNIETVDDIKGILKQLDIIHKYADPVEGYKNIYNKFTEFFQNLDQEDLLNSIQSVSGIKLKNCACIIANQENLHAYPFDKHISFPKCTREYSLPSPRDFLKVSWAEINLPQTGTDKILDRKTRSDSKYSAYIENLNFRCDLYKFTNENAENYENRIQSIPLIFCQFITAERTPKLIEFLLNPLNFQFYPIHCEYSGIRKNSMENASMFLYTPLKDTNYLGKDSNNIEIYKADLNNYYNIKTNIINLYKSYLLPLQKGIIKYFKNNNYKDIIKIFEYLNMGEVLLYHTLKNCKQKIYEYLTSKFPDFPTYIPSIDYPGWQISMNKTDTKYLVITPYIYYTDKKVSKYKTGYGTNPKWKPIFNFGLPKEQAFNKLEKSIRKVLKTKKFNLCKLEGFYIYIPWDLFD